MSRDWPSTLGSSRLPGIERGRGAALLLQAAFLLGMFASMAAAGNVDMARLVERSSISSGLQNALYPSGRWSCSLRTGSDIAFGIARTPVIAPTISKAKIIQRPCQRNVQLRFRERSNVGVVGVTLRQRV